MSTNLIYAKPIKATDIYGKNFVCPDIPGYKVVAFRPPVKGELFLDVASECYKYGISSRFHNYIVIASGNYIDPRVILEKTSEVVLGSVKTEITVKDVYLDDTVEIPDGYEFVRFGLVYRGEVYIYPKKDRGVRVASEDLRSPRIIIAKKIE